jgi:hypothetical protein
MPKDALNRFIARANSEGIPLNSRATSVGFSRFGLTAAFLVALLLISATLDFGFHTKSTDQTGRGDAASIARSLSDNAENSQGAPENVAPIGARASRTASRRKANHNGRSVQFLVTRSSDHGRPSRVYSADPEQNQLGLTAYSRNLAMLNRPHFVIGKLEQDIQWSPPRYAIQRFHFADLEEFAKSDQPRLLAEYDHRTFAPWSLQESFAPGHSEARVLPRDFDPNSYRTLLNPGFTKNLPAFRFAPNALQ